MSLYARRHPEEFLRRLRFHPGMSLMAAARTAHAHGLELKVAWEGDQCVVTTMTPIDKMEVPAFLKQQAG